GDLPGESTVTVKWIMTCSLAGQFISYDASYQHISPIGDADISLIESLSIHELIHIVLIDGEDNLWDFLVNDVVDPWFLPETVHSSKNSSTYPVYSIRNYTEISRISYPDGLLVVTFEVELPTDGFIYIRIDDLASDSYSIRNATRSDG